MLTRGDPLLGHDELLFIRTYLSIAGGGDGGVWSGERFLVRAWDGVWGVFGIGGVVVGGEGEVV
jgi:hypothetical protein